MDFPKRLAVSSATPNPTVFYSQKLWGFIFLVLEPWAVWSGLGLGLLASQVSFPVFIHHMWTWDHLFHWLPPPLPHHPLSSLPQLPVSSPPAHLDEYFFFKSLVVGLPHTSIFWQFWFFSVLKLVVILLRVVKGAVCLCFGWRSNPLSFRP